MIVAESLSKYYGDKAAIQELSFTIDQGKVVGLLGLNGAGKTTTLRILSGLLVPTGGKVFVAGLDMAEHPEAVRSRIGFLPETPPLYGEMLVRDYVTFAANIRGLRKNVRAHVDEALASTDLTAVANERINTLSHGYQRRIGIAQAIVHKPALILLDEPTSGLDPVQVIQMRKLIGELKHKHTVLVSSHILGEIHQLCDEILVLQKGQLAARGTESELAKKLAGNVTCVVEVRGSQAALEAALLRASVAKHRIDMDNGGVVQATVELLDDSRDHLAKTLVTSDLGLLRLERVQLELESIFLSLAGSTGAAKAQEVAEV